eukprot:TRINITY_DN32678_c0_g1_i1.p1 TRINITY_DN32678_c0_g1~~TRINITY_DN32678_c0_g1_i1.p1  ORF type:complete len:251 (+),score=71.00 TRINITY_DN32678_c0_g1_i1:65-754(+)
MEDGSRVQLVRELLGLSTPELRRQDTGLSADGGDVPVVERLLSTGPDWAAFAARACRAEPKLDLSLSVMYRLAHPGLVEGPAGSRSLLHTFLDALVKECEGSGSPVPSVCDMYTAAVDRGHVQVVQTLQQVLPVSLDEGRQAKADELLSWGQGAVVSENKSEVQSCCIDAGITWTDDHERCCGLKGTVLKLDALLPQQLTNLDTFLLCFGAGERSYELLLPPTVLRRPD